MSAALDIQLFIDYFGKCPVVNGMSWFKGTSSHVGFSISLRAGQNLKVCPLLPSLVSTLLYKCLKPPSICEYSVLQVFKATLPMLVFYFTGN